MVLNADEAPRGKFKMKYQLRPTALFTMNLLPEVMIDE